MEFEAEKQEAERHYFFLSALNEFWVQSMIMLSFQWLVWYQL